mmetsp:Transcript_10293/g.25613  ORF Transcript_10293/g.25613 Transcript_10293/m.25613 type:complete len:221 (+) Transcript_10293:206-868(+)
MCHHSAFVTSSISQLPLQPLSRQVVHWSHPKLAIPSHTHCVKTCTAASFATQHHHMHHVDPSQGAIPNLTQSSTSHPASLPTASPAPSACIFSRVFPSHLGILSVHFLYFFMISSAWDRGSSRSAFLPLGLLGLTSMVDSSPLSSFVSHQYATPPITTSVTIPLMTCFSSPNTSRVPARATPPRATGRGTDSGTRLATESTTPTTVSTIWEPPASSPFLP